MLRRAALCCGLALIVLLGTLFAGADRAEACLPATEEAAAQLAAKNRRSLATVASDNVRFANPIYATALGASVRVTASRRDQRVASPP